MENDKNQVVFNIYGGSIQILPTATQAVQYFYGDQFARLVLTEKEGTEAPLTAEERRLLVFMESVEAMRNYVALLDACEDAAAVGRVVAIMCENEPHLDSERIVKKEFIETLLPFIPKVLKGRGIDNLRVQINQAWAKRKREARR